MAYKIIIKPSAIKDLDILPDVELNKILTRINQLKEEPRPIGIQKLTDKEGYRIRSGNYRVLFEINDKLKSVLIYRIKHRKDIYK
ncbi:MAG: type II toxin-antitoxin system RelE/ParE family toxin [Ignavibacteriales bacterium]|nr:type II toxin-antitoxin system RelE/ParE family toxin [Ignavibacteriales bacterium]